MPGAEQYQQTGFGRVFLQEYGAGPANPYSYQGCAKMGTFSEPGSELTPVRCPSPDDYDEFETVDTVRGEAGLPTSNVVARLQPRSTILHLKCPFDLQAHYGECETPSDFESWNQVIVMEKARFTTKGSDGELTALEEGERAAILINGAVTSQHIWYIEQMTLAEVAGDEVTNEIVGVAVDPRVLCDRCGLRSDGTDRLYAVATTPWPTSPGLPTELLFSDDKGATWEEHLITTLGVLENPTGLALVGNKVVVISDGAAGIHWCPMSDLEDWTAVNVGFNAAGPPEAIWSVNATNTWIVGDGGYIYYTENPAAGVVVQNGGAGGAAAGQNLNDVHACSTQTIVAVGAAGTVVYSLNGGTTWIAPTNTGLTGNALYCCWAHKSFRWFAAGVGGDLYFTDDSGEDWAVQAFPGSGAGNIYDIAFVDHSDSPFGFMAHDPAGVERGRILRTISGGSQWVVLPETAGVIPDNAYIGCLAACRDPNFVFAGGVAANGIDGILIIGA